MGWGVGGSIDEKTNLEAHEELTCSSAATDDIEALHLQSLPDVAYSWISKNIWRRRTPRSFYIVLFNAKITMLLPVGPLAIWLHIFTQNQGASASLNIPVAFISAILFPVVGNIWSIMFSMSEKLDLTLGVPIGLSTQTAMFSDGKSNCFIGLIFIMCYLIIAASFYGRWLIYYWCRQCSLASLLVCCVGTLNHRDLSTKNLHDQLLRQHNTPDCL